MKAIFRKIIAFIWVGGLLLFLTGCEKKHQVPNEMYIRPESNSNLNVDYEWIKMTRYEGDGLYVSFYAVGIWTGDAIANSSKSTNSNDDFFYRFSNNKRGAVNEGCLVSYEIVPKLDKNSTAGCNVSHYQPYLLLDSSIEDITLTEESGGFKLNWSPMNGASYYYVLRRADVDNGNGTGVTLIAQLLDRVSGNTYLDKNVVTGKYYEYYVLAYKQFTGLDVKSVATGSSYFDGTNSGGDDGGSSSSNSAPRGLYISMYNSGTTTTVYLQWFGVSDAINYKVYRATDPNGIWAYYASSTTEDYEDTKVSNGVTYYYRVSAVTSEGEGPKSSYASCTISNSGSGGGGGGGTSTTKPSTPTGLTATANQSYIDLSWNSVSSASKYNVYRSTSAYGSFSLIKSTTSTSFTDNSVSSGTTYYYKVSAENGYGESSLSSYVSAKLGTSGGGSSATKPSTPTGLTATGNQSYIGLSWNSVSNASRYNVYRSTSAYGSFSLVKSTTSTSYTDSSVSSGMTYYYKISAENSYGESSLSSYVSAKPGTSGGGGGSSTTKPSTPTGLKATANQSYIGLSWNAVSNATKYYIYRSESAYGTYSLLDESYTNSYTDRKVLVSGKTYYYKISAVNIGGESSQSSYTYCKYEIIYAPCAPQGVSVTEGYSSLTIKWNVSTSNGCGKPTSQKISFYNPSKRTWEEKTVQVTSSSGSYYLTGTSLSQYTIASYLVTFIIELKNSEGKVTWEFEYNLDKGRITHYEEVK